MNASSAAPDRVQDVRAFLNTLRRPHQSRELVDDLDVLDQREWEQRMPGLPWPPAREKEMIRRLRDELRAGLGDDVPRIGVEWFEGHPVTAVPGDSADPVQLVPTTADTVGVALTLVLRSVQDRTWSRLKACPDCRHVFYDHSRNRSRTWCGMYAGAPDGRACGSIAKVRAYRQRQRLG